MWSDYGGTYSPEEKAAIDRLNKEFNERHEGKILNCPFCGSSPRYLVANPGFYTERIICDSCHFQLPVKDWQNRVSQK